MTEVLVEYSRYFAVGQRAMIGIPLAGGEVFRDWAVITEMDQNLLVVQLSRDDLPENVQVWIGSILELRVGKDGSAFYCRAIIISERAGNVLVMRLTSNVISDELRDYFRIDIFLPVSYRRLTTQNEDVIREHWLETRLAKEFAAYAQDGNTPAAPSGFHVESVHKEQPLLIVANVSGSGLRITIPESLEPDELIGLELFIPSTPPKVLDIVGQVMHVHSVHGGDNPPYSTALHFKFIDERDRDSIIGHISAIQILRHREEKARTLYTENAESASDRYSVVSLETIVRRAFYVALFLFISFCLIKAVQYYRERKDLHVIEMEFENGIKKYMEKQRR